MVKRAVVNPKLRSELANRIRLFSRKRVFHEHLISSLFTKNTEIWEIVHLECFQIDWNRREIVRVFFFMENSNLRTSRRLPVWQTDVKRWRPIGWRTELLRTGGVDAPTADCQTGRVGTGLMLDTQLRAALPSAAPRPPASSSAPSHLGRGLLSAAPAAPPL